MYSLLLPPLAGLGGLLYLFQPERLLKWHLAALPLNYPTPAFVILTTAGALGSSAGFYALGAFRKEGRSHALRDITWGTVPLLMVVFAAGSYGVLYTVGFPMSEVGVKVPVAPHFIVATAFLLLWALIIMIQRIGRRKLQGRLGSSP